MSNDSLVDKAAPVAAGAEIEKLAYRVMALAKLLEDLDSDGVHPERAETAHIIGECAMRILDLTHVQEAA